jgi:hypothetical protein
MIPAIRKRLDLSWQLGLWLAVTLRVGLGMVALLAVHLEPVRGVGGEWLDLVIRGGGPWSELLSTWQRWDALWYQQIATNGYRAGDGTVAF